MKKLILIFCLLAHVSFGQTYDTLKQDKYVDGDTSNLRQLLIGSNKQLSNYELHAKRIYLFSMDSLGNVKVYGTSSFGNNQMLLSAENSSGNISSYLQVNQSPTTALTLLYSKTPNSSAYIQLLTNNTIGSNLNSRSNIMLRSVADQSTNKMVTLTLNAGDSSQKRAVYTELNVVAPHKGIMYGGDDYVTDPRSLTTKKYVDDNVMLNCVKASLPACRGGMIILVVDATGGSVPAFCDGTYWRRVTDRTIIN